ncbi:BglG family transcription antiterminator LicT [Candidatus Stoquefichus massiliensis]|uniref:BglG family transcription antiterminator LicT n=1 Tax=Candidatus Stoquefichus massiliensis TaxID=1470350 RepID=UPI000487A4BB|nr:PRD domain-containing protein [Candidatus Stoquefichus massiliensis]
MIIKRILNNNAVMSLDEHGEEIIVKGKGIAFHKKTGDIIDEKVIDKIFVMNNQETKRRYQEILISIPSDCMSACEDMIGVIKQNIEKELSDKIYVTLTDHIYNLIERVKMGIVFDNALLWDVKRLYVKEYQVGLIIVDMIRQKFDIKIENDEASFIALHIVNAQMNTEFHDVIEITGMIDDIYDIVESQFDLQIDKESLEYTRFIMHLRVFFERIVNHENLKSEKSKTLLKILKDEYPRQYQCVMKIIDYVMMRYEELLEGEILYLLVHVIKLTEQ